MQSYSRIEHIVMDGGSTDGSTRVLEQHSRPDLRWTRERDRGQSHALNKAFAASRGEIIGWLNSDDAYCAADAVAAAVEAFQGDPELDVVYGHALLVNADGLIVQTLWVPPFSRRLLRLHDFIIQPAAFIRRSALGDELADETFDFTMDYELWLRLSQTRRFRRLGRLLAIDRHQVARKSYVMADVGLSDTMRLHAMYGANVGPAAWIARKLMKVAQRIIGATLIPAAVRDRPGFGLRSDGKLRLLRRQVAMKRAEMPAGATGEDDAAGVTGAEDEPSA